MFIAEMAIKDVPPFRGEVGFKFDKRVNVFIGPNASGKSTLLRHIFETLKKEWDGSDNQHLRMASDFGIICGNPVKIHEGVRVKFVSDHDEQQNKWDVIAIPALRIGHGHKESNGKCIMNSEDQDYYGVEDLERPLYADDIQFSINEIVGDGGIENHQAHTVQDVINVAHECTRNICREIIRREPPQTKFTTVVEDDDPIFPSAETIKELGMRIRTHDYLEATQYLDGSFAVTHVPPLDISALSAGTETVEWWIRLIAISLFEMHGWQNGWQSRPAILLIDEIENHLHPTWQRRVIPALLDHFPGLQIFATTHSPFVVAGLKAGQVHLLKRENGVVSTTTNTENIEGWTADEILRVYMGVGEPTDEHTAKAAQQLRRLRDEGPRADERAEAERQSEIARLRQIVDRATLSGPRAAEDARFLANLEAILERYQQTQDLNQENG